MVVESKCMCEFDTLQNGAGQDRTGQGRTRQGIAGRRRAACRGVARSRGRPRSPGWPVRTRSGPGSRRRVRRSWRCCPDGRRARRWWDGTGGDGVAGWYAVVWTGWDLVLVWSCAVSSRAFLCCLVSPRFALSSCLVGFCSFILSHGTVVMSWCGLSCLASCHVLFSLA